MTIFSLDDIFFMAQINSPDITDVDWCGSMMIDVFIDERIVSFKLIYELFDKIAYCDCLDIVADLMEDQFIKRFNDYYEETYYINKDDMDHVSTRFFSNNITFGEYAARFIKDCYEQSALRARYRIRLMEKYYQRSFNQIQEDSTAFDIDSLEPPAPEDDEYNRAEGFPPDDNMVYSDYPDDDYPPIESYETPTNDDTFTMDEENDNAIENDSNLNISEEEDVLCVLQESRVARFLDFLKKEGYVNDLGVPCKYKNKWERNTFWFLICFQLNIPNEWTILAKLTNENNKSIENLYYKYYKTEEYDLLVEEFKELHNKYVNNK